MFVLRETEPSNQCKKSLISWHCFLFETSWKVLFKSGLLNDIEKYSGTIDTDRKHRLTYFGLNMLHRSEDH